MCHNNGRLESIYKYNQSRHLFASVWAKLWRNRINVQPRRVIVVGRHSKWLCQLFYNKNICYGTYIFNHRRI